jgi:hypothetical protein
VKPVVLVKRTKDNRFMHWIDVFILGDKPWILLGGSIRFGTIRIKSP